MRRTCPRSRLLLAALVVVVAATTLVRAPGAMGEVNDTFDQDGIPRTVTENFALPLEALGGQVHALAQLEPEEAGDYDPWEPFNEKMFWFNHQVLDRFLVKPVATVWDKVMPDRVKRSLKNAFSNLGMPRRLLNNVFQGKIQRAGLELARFTFNSTAGIGGLFDVATAIDIPEVPDEDAGQTLGVYGAGPGPYLVLPFLPPLTVRDGIGFGIDSVMDPLNYLLPFGARAGITAGKAVNDRALNLERFQEVEETVLDLYSAVRNGYLQRREQMIRE